jgi:ABC-type nitrate/sulfonate/bicarbonate transport system substrate-binding protein
MGRNMLRFLKALASAGTISVVAALASAAFAEPQTFTQWGWPQPYERVSEKSVSWLKEKGWWPLTFGWQGPFSGQNTVNVVLSKMDFLAKRGLETKFQAFAAGPDVNEAVAAGRVQIGNGGNFPFTSLLDRGIPVKALAVVAPNLKHSTVAPIDSKLKSLEDLKGSNPPATIGIVTGSSAEFYFTQAAATVGLQIGKDVILKNMPPSEQLLMARGIAAVVPWEPSVTILTDERKTGKEIDTIFPYNFYEGVFYIRSELIENAPDVAQAISDAFMEATLWIRLNPDKAATFLAEEPILKAYGQLLLLQQTKFYNNLYKPTASYPFAAFWSEENARIATWLKERNRITHLLTAKDYESAFEERFMKQTYEKLGWKVPPQPPFLPAGWTGSLGKLPYPPYLNVQTMKEPQEWPQPSDLSRTWAFDGKTYTPQGTN